jgi:hypothetical protein
MHTRTRLRGTPLVASHKLFDRCGKKFGVTREMVQKRTTAAPCSTLNFQRRRLRYPALYQRRHCRIQQERTRRQPLFFAPPKLGLSVSFER